MDIHSMKNYQMKTILYLLANLMRNIILLSLELIDSISTI